MAHTFEPAASRRSRCRACGGSIACGEIRFGERLHNLFGEGEMTLWFHPRCAAFKRPEPILQALTDAHANVPGREELERLARASLAHRRLPRIDGAERATSSQARCRHCRQPIPKGAWRIRLVYFEEGFFNPGGFIHVGCRGPYFGEAEVLEPVLHFSRGLSDADREELERAMASQP